jgi:hypothetical protein
MSDNHYYGGDDDGYQGKVFQVSRGEGAGLGPEEVDHESIFDGGNRSNWKAISAAPGKRRPTR